MKKRFSGLTVAAIVLVSVFAGMEINQLISGDDIYAQLGKFKDILVLTEKYYVDEVDTQKLTDAAIGGFLDNLDPHSVYIAPKAFERVTEDFKGKYEGIGISFRVLNDTITVLEPIGGGPSSRLGILANDRIVEINGKSSVGFKETQVTQTLRGPKGTRVTVKIARPGISDPLIFEITREEISILSVDAAFMSTDNIGYIRVNKFNEQTNTEMEKALRKLTEQGMKRLVLDLRVNPGGYLEQAVKMSDLFLDGGSKETPRKIVSVKARRPEFDESYFARTGEQYERLPVIVLIQNSSASASEIVAGAIQDWDRGLIVGETSFGKGLVQRQWTLADGSALRLTIAKYYTPSGRLIQRAYEGKEKSDYQREAFERSEEEGENIEHDKDSKSAKDTARPVFKTNGGRVVYGGGGITPDYIVKNEELGKTSAPLWRLDAFTSFISSYMTGRGIKLRSTYGSDSKRFRETFKVTDEMLNDFRRFAEGKSIKVDEQDFQKDLSYIKVELKAGVAQQLWGREAQFPIFLELDKQFQKALTLFPEAEKIARLN